MINNVQPAQIASDPEMARVAAEFLKRVNLTGAEVPAFLQVQQWLMMKANPMAMQQAQAMMRDAANTQHGSTIQGPGPVGQGPRHTNPTTGPVPDQATENPNKPEKGKKV